MIQEKSSTYSTYPVINHLSEYTMETIGRCCNLNGALFIASFALLGLAFEAVRTSLKGKLNKISLAIGAAVGIVLSISILFIRTYMQNKDCCDESEECCEEDEEEGMDLEPQTELEKKPVIHPEQSPQDPVKVPEIIQPAIPVIEKNETLEECISNYVSRFLDPYIRGKINPENEPKNRPPLMDQIVAKIKSSGFQVEENIIVDLGIKAYAYEAARGIILRANATKSPCTPGSEKFVDLYKLLRNFARVSLEDNNFEEALNDIEKTKKLLPETTDFNLMVNALEAALPKDFPSMKLSREEIEKIALNGLSDFIILNYIEEHKARNFHVAGYMEDRLPKMERLSQLKKTGKFFLSDHQEKSQDKAILTPEK